MASSSSNPRSYDVFLSFRGPDVRNSFLSHLYTALDQRGIYTFIDEEELRKGEQISPALIKAIEESRIAIIVFSEDYASSPWCLEEVAKIMECKAQKDLIVWPVFYKVEPREVRDGRQNYAKAMGKHESKFGKDSEKVKRWKKALFYAGSLSGWDFNDGNEAKLIKSIVEKISRQLERTSLDVAKHPVGIHRRVVKLKSMLNLESSNDVVMIGLWGQGGVGKTTLAKAIYNDIFRKFDGSCFLANVREESKDSKYLVPLQKTLLSEILLTKSLEVHSVDEGIELIRQRLCCKKVLLVLDDVNDKKQLDALARECKWFGKGSRIIITTRDKHLLTCHGIRKGHIYETETLEDGEALELFNKHAFLGNNPIGIRRDLIHSALSHANGLPLALVVLGSFLCDKRECEWESALNKLANSPHEDINNVLKLSYDGLEDYAKEIFLDIACFFKGWPIGYITKVLDCCNFYTTIGVRVLVDKSLIIEERGTLQMHDLIQLMGMDIVKQKYPDDPERRSRLWDYDDVHDVLSSDMGTNAVKAIVLRLPEPEEICIHPNAFTNLRKLRVLIMINAHNSFEGPICLPNGLRYFEWPECPWFPKFSFGPKKLAGLDLRRSNIQLVEKQFKDFKNLKFINFSECQSLVFTPNLDCVPNLLELNLYGCTNLERIHESVGHHGKLQSLNLNQCSKLQSFPDISDKNKALRKLNLGWTSIKKLPDSIANLVSLEDLWLDNCKELEILPSIIYGLQNLEKLSVERCSKLIKFPKKEEDLSDPNTKTGFPKLQSLVIDSCKLSEVEFLENQSCFPILRFLSLRGNNFTSLPRLGHLYNLMDLNVMDNQQLQEIVEFPGQLRHLSTSGCRSLSKIPSDICRIDDVDLALCQELVRTGFTMNNWLKLEDVLPRKESYLSLPGGEMPSWLLPNEEGCISFTISKDLYKKFLGLALCIVCRGKEANEPDGCEFQAYINGKSVNQLPYGAWDINCNHVYFGYWKSKEVWTEDPFGPNDWSHFQFKLVPYGPNFKKYGFRLMCSPLENNLELLPEDDQMLDPALLYEVWHEDSQTSTEEESSSGIEDA